MSTTLGYPYVSCVMSLISLCVGKYQGLCTEHHSRVDVPLQVLTPRISLAFTAWKYAPMLVCLGHLGALLKGRTKFPHRRLCLSHALPAWASLWDALLQHHRLLLGPIHCNPPPDIAVRARGRWRRHCDGRGRIPIQEVDRSTAGMLCPHEGHLGVRQGAVEGWGRG